MKFAPSLPTGRPPGGGGVFSPLVTVKCEEHCPLIGLLMSLSYLGLSKNMMDTQKMPFALGRINCNHL